MVIFKSYLSKKDTYLAPVETVDSRRIEDIKFLLGILLRCQHYTPRLRSFSGANNYKNTKLLFQVCEQLPAKSRNKTVRRIPLYNVL